MNKLMFKLLFSLSCFLLFFGKALSAEVCRIELADKIIVSSNSLPDKSIIKKHVNCEKTTVSKLLKAIGSMQGEINTRRLSTVLKNDFQVKESIQFYPTKISLNTFEELVNNSLKLQDGLVLKDVSLMRNEKSFSLSNSTTIKVFCSDCDKPGEKTLKLQILDENFNLVSEHWVKSKIYRRLQVLVSKDNFPAFTDGLQSKFQMVYHEVLDPNLYYTSTQNLKFFKLNKGINKNGLLKNSDLTPLTLVRPGRMTKINLSHKDLIISSFAISRSSGKYGETVELYNPKTKKRFTGKVVDHNTVKVDL